MTQTAGPAPGTTSGAAPDRRLLLIVVLGSLTAIGPLSIDLYLPALPELTADLSTAASHTQLTLTACVAGLALGQAFAGPLSDTMGRRRPLLAGLAAYAAASLLCAASPTVETLIALRMVQGVAGAAGIVIARAIVRDLYQGAAAARFFSMLMLVTGLAPILAPVIGGQLLRLVPWQGLFATLSGIGVALFLGALLVLHETLPPARRATGGVRATAATFRTLLTDWTFAGYALTIGLVFGAMFTYISGSPFVLQGIYGMSPQTYGIAFGANALGIITFSQVSGRLAGRVPLRLLLAAGLALIATGGTLLLVAVLTGAGLYVVLPSLFVITSGQGFVLPNATALALSSESAAQAAGSGSALLGVAQFALGGAAAPLAGIAGPDTAVPMAASIAGLGTLAFLVAATANRASKAAASRPAGEAEPPEKPASAG
ncbi:MAG TPA: multidrug effflux MFS transporter [Spirillospora sp.]